MKVVVLGNQASFPKAGHHHTSLLVSDNNTNVLFDIGPGTNSQFQKYISFTKLDAIFITHMHMDHVLDLPTLTFAVYMYNSLRGGNIKIPVYVPPGGMSFINELLEVLDAIEYKTSIKIIELNEEVYVYYNEDLSIKGLYNKDRQYFIEAYIGDGNSVEID